MKKIIFTSLVIALVVLGLTIGPAYLNYDGYFLIALESGTYQMSIFGLIGFSVTALMCLWFLSIVFKKTIYILSGSQDWLFGFSSRRRKRAFTSGLIALAEGNYQQADKLLTKIIEEDYDGLNLLGLAEAKAQSNDKQSAMMLWHKAAELPKTTLAANLCIIRELINSKDSKQALTYIENLDENAKKDGIVIKLWIRALNDAQQYSVIKTSLPKWKKALGDEYSYWLAQTSKGEFAEVASKQGANKLMETWAALPRATKKETGQIAAYGQQLIDQGMYEEAQIVLVQSQKSGPNALLYSLFRQLKNLQTNAASKQLEGWLKKDPDSVDLLSTLGQLAFNQGDQLLAEKALSKAVKLTGESRDILLLAQIKEAQHDTKQALELYKKVAL